MIRHAADAFAVANRPADSLNDKLAVSTGTRGHMVGRLLGPITRITETRVYYDRTVNGVRIRETYALKREVAFIVDTEEEYTALENYDRRRQQVLDEQIELEKTTFHERIKRYNATGRGLR